VKVVATGMTWGEGPRWHDGALWLSDTQGSKLWTDATGEWTGIPVPATSNGLWFLPDGRLVGAMMHEQRIGVWDGEKWATYADLAHLGVGPLGDMVGDDAGNLYVDDVAFNAAAGEAPAPGSIILVRPDGTATVAAQGVTFPNGLALIDGGHTLVVALTTEQALDAFDVGPDATLRNRRRYADIADLAGSDARPDGIWASDDGIWVATTTGQSLVLVHDGEVVRAHDTTPAFPIACCVRDDGALIATLAETDGQPLMAALAAKAVRTTAVLIQG